MAGEGRQLAFDLPHRPASGRDDFLVTPSNAKAVALIDLWPNWPSNTLILLGPAGSGKSHLAAVWHERLGIAGSGAIACGLAKAASGRIPAQPTLLWARSEESAARTADRLGSRGDVTTELGDLASNRVEA